MAFPGHGSDPSHGFHLPRSCSNPLWWAKDRTSVPGLQKCLRPHCATAGAPYFILILFNFRTCSGYCFGQLRSTSYVLKNSLPAEMSIGVPIKVLHEAEGHIVTCETNTGEVYRGKLIEAEDNMNCQMSNITVTYRDGRVAQLEQVYIRGSKIRFLILPDMLKNAPMLKSMKNKNQGSGAGRGKAAILKAQGYLVAGRCVLVYMS
uniref:Small nuclear ribonucleoprotein Sm D3 n=2 Tax=Sus scrofa TaxID=9823 RepID=A0A5G2QV25_PIG